MIERTKLTVIGPRVEPPPGLVYSTAPIRGEGENGKAYFMKGPNIEIVFAEIAGCMLAREVGLLVPDVAVCEGDGDDIYAGSEWVLGASRDIGPWLKRPKTIGNFEDLLNAVAVDVWLANTDRNIGNVLARPRNDKKFELVFIDFEKSLTLRPFPVILSNIQPGKLWPTGDLGHEIRAKKTLVPPALILQRIGALTTGRCNEIIQQVVAAMSVPVSWAADSVHALSHRAGQIRPLVEELWVMN